MMATRFSQTLEEKARPSFPLLVILTRSRFASKRTPHMRINGPGALFGEAPCDPSDGLSGEQSNDDPAPMSRSESSREERLRSDRDKPQAEVLCTNDSTAPGARPNREAGEIRAFLGRLAAFGRRRLLRSTPGSSAVVRMGSRTVRLKSNSSRRLRISKRTASMGTNDRNHFARKAP
jgi:hypothetical protein